MRNGGIYLAKINKITLTLPSMDSQPDAQSFINALKNVETNINKMIDEINNSVKFVSEGDGYMEVQKDS